jgi:hypothetical protein
LGVAPDRELLTLLPALPVPSGLLLPAGAIVVCLPLSTALCILPPFFILFSPFWLFPSDFLLPSFRLDVVVAIVVVVVVVAVVVLVVGRLVTDDDGVVDNFFGLLFVLSVGDESDEDLQARLCRIAERALV